MTGGGGGAFCAALLLLLFLLSPAAADDTIEEVTPVAEGGSSQSKLVSSIDCQICEATCRVKCLVSNPFQWGGCYQLCKADSCNDFCR
jgi:hypothetical protein